MNVDELVTILGLKTDPNAERTAAGFGRLLGGIIGLAVKAGAALAGAATAVNAYAIAQSAAIDETGKFSDSIGLNFEKLQELEYAATRSGGSVNELRGDLEKLSKMPGRGDAADKLLRIADRLQGLSKRQQQNFADIIGLSPGTLRVLQGGRDNIEALAKRSRQLGLVLDNVAKERAAKFQASFTDLKQVVQGVGKEISVGLLPNLTRTVEKFTDWIGVNRGWISLGIQQVVKGVGEAFDVLGRGVSYVWKQVEKLTGPFGELVKDLDISQPVMIAVTAAVGALGVAFIAANAPIIAITAAIAGVVLVIDDLYAYFNGGDSIVGRWVSAFTTKFPNISAAVRTVYDTAVKIFDQLLTDSGKMLDTLVDNFKAAWKTITDLIDALVKVIDNLLGGIENPFEPLVKWFEDIGKKLLEMAGNIAKGIVDKILGGLRDLGSKVQAVVDGAVEFVTGPKQYAPGEGPSIMDGYTPPTAPVSPRAPVPADLLGRSGGSNTTNNTINQTINGAGDPRAVGQESVNRMGLGGSLQQMRPGLFGPTVG